MTTATRSTPRGNVVGRDEPRFITHPSFLEPGAAALYGGAPEYDRDETARYMADDLTRDCARRMHYAAWRASEAATPREATRWRRCYYDLRNRIVLGNEKLTYRAVQKWNAPPQLADDMAGDCQIVLIHAVAAFNPWLGIRFSTYAFTCLMRALSRISQRHASDRLSRSLPLESLPYGEPDGGVDGETYPQEIGRLDEYLAAEHTLLTAREKIVLTRRFHLNGQGPTAETLEQVGRDLGLSKERVRQVQMSALGKLRSVLLSSEVAS